MTHETKTLVKLLRQGWRGDTATDLMTEAADVITRLSDIVPADVSSTPGSVTFPEPTRAPERRFFADGQEVTPGTPAWDVAPMQYLDGYLPDSLKPPTEATRSDIADEISGIQIGSGYESTTIGITAALEAADALKAAFHVTPKVGGE